MSPPRTLRLTRLTRPMLRLTILCRRTIILRLTITIITLRITTVTFITTNGAAFNLTQADEITVKIANDSGYIMSKDIDPSTITNPENGEFLLPVDDSIMDVLTPDDYYIDVLQENRYRPLK